MGWSLRWWVLLNHTWQSKYNKSGYTINLVVLLRNTGVDIATINLVWTFGFFGYMVGSLATSFVFKEYIKSEKGKLSFLAITICITGVSRKNYNSLLIIIIII